MEKIMRLKIRFRVDKRKMPYELYEKMKQEIT